MSTSYGSQFRALAYKNLTLQSRRKGSTCCQIFLPMICVLLVALVQTFTMTPGSTRVYPGYTEWVTSRSSYWDNWGQYNYINALYTNPSDPTSEPAGILSSNGTKSGMLGALVQMAVPPPQWYYNATTYMSPTFTEFSNLPDMYSYMEQNLSAVAEDIYNGNCWQEYYYGLTCIHPDSSFNFRHIRANASQETALLDYTVQAGYIGHVNYVGYSDTQYNYGYYMNMMSNALLNYTVQGKNFGNLTIVGGFTSYPEMQMSSDIIGSIISFIVFPFTVSMLLPTYMHTIVEEKKKGLVQMMQVSGLSIVSYWVINYLYHFLLYFVFAGVMVAFGFGFSVRLFTTNWLQVVVLLFLWGNAQITFAYFLTCFLTTPNAANVIGFLLAIFGSLVATILEFFVFLQAPAQMPYFLYLLYPGFVFAHGFSMLFFSLLTDVVKSNSFYPGTIFSNMLLILVAQIFIFGLLALYFERVMPRSVGIAYHPLFPVFWVHKKCKKLIRGKNTVDYSEMESDNTVLLKRVDGSMSPMLGDRLHLDEDVLQEREATLREGAHHSAMVRIANLSKIYSASNGNNAKTALNQISFRIMRNECFGLLGPNGAGKTTLINILSGSSTPSSGTALIDGLDIRSRMTSVHKLIGVCPQFDVLWDELTVREHLLFYTRMKAYERASESRHVKFVIEEVGLEEVVNRLAKDLSGGQKRRLSIAIAMMGNPRLIMMDEPTTGLDPSSRRAVWDIIVKAKERHSIILSTHSMEEAEVLCSRIGIMRKAQLHSIGNQLQLKNKFNLGYNIKVSHVLNMDDRAHAFVTSLLPRATLVHAFGGTRSYKVNKADFVLSDLFVKMETNKARNGIKAWSISQASLEEVFLAITEQDESDHSLNEV